MFIKLQNNYYRVDNILAVRITKKWEPEDENRTIFITYEGVYDPIELAYSTREEAINEYNRIKEHVPGLTEIYDVLIRKEKVLYFGIDWDTIQFVFGQYDDYAGYAQFDSREDAEQALKLLMNKEFMEVD